MPDDTPAHPAEPGRYVVTGKATGTVTTPTEGDTTAVVSDHEQRQEDRTDG